MPNKAKHAFGNSENINAALEAGTINNYDILFLDGATDPKIGWINNAGEVVLVENEQYVVTVDSDVLPATGEKGVIYIFNNEGYIWNGTQFVALAKSADLSALEQAIANKVDEATVDQKIEAAVDSSIEIVEF